MALQERVEGVNHTAAGVTAPGHALVGGEQQAVVVVALQGRAADERHEVLDVAVHGQFEVGGRALDRAVVLADGLDDVGDVESGAKQRRAAAGGAVAEVDQWCSSIRRPSSM
jgi:hypothetical protein